jgi:hypothetical protein
MSIVFDPNYLCATGSLLDGANPPGTESLLPVAKPFGIEILLTGGDGRCFIGSPQLLGLILHVGSMAEAIVR